MRIYYGGVNNVNSSSDYRNEIYNIGYILESNFIVYILFHLSLFTLFYSELY